MDVYSVLLLMRPMDGSLLHKQQDIQQRASARLFCAMYNSSDLLSLSLSLSSLDILLIQQQSILSARITVNYI
jgi:hypothetical protein